MSNASETTRYSVVAAAFSNGTTHAALLSDADLKLSSPLKDGGTAMDHCQLRVINVSNCGKAQHCGHMCALYHLTCIVVGVISGLWWQQ
jgi:hypothetical protein